jgi:hypothetical protein
VPQAANHAKSRKKFDEAMTAIVNDVKKLVSQQATASDGAQK